MCVSLGNLLFELMKVALLSYLDNDHESSLDFAYKERVQICGSNVRKARLAFTKTLP